MNNKLMREHIVIESKEHIKELKIRHNNKKPSLDDLIDKADGENPHKEQISDTQGKEIL